VKKFSKLDAALLLEAFTSGGQVNLFDLLEVLGRKYLMNNPVIKRVVEGLRSGSKIEEGSELDKDETHKQMRMKLTAKVARHGFDLRYFFASIDVMKKG
jgi:hypothetical protein